MQVDILRSLKHPAIVEVKGLFEKAGERLLFVMEFCEGGELFDRIVKKVRLRLLLSCVRVYGVCDIDSLPCIICQCGWR